MSGAEHVRARENQQELFEDSLGSAVDGEPIVDQGHLKVTEWGGGRAHGACGGLQRRRVEGH